MLGFPANDFKAQEPGTNEEIQAFCTTNFGVKFPLFDKIPVVGPAKHPLYAALIAAQPKAISLGQVTWRDKLKGYGIEGHRARNPLELREVSRQSGGEVVKRFAPDITPDDEQITAAIERELQAR